MSSIWALLVKRFNIYKRDKCGLVCEILVPVILVLMGLSLLQISWLHDSKTVTLNTDAFPKPQRILFNDAPISTAADQYTISDVYENLPEYGSYFKVSESSSTDYLEFYSDITANADEGDEKPYRFGAYQIY